MTSPIDPIDPVEAAELVQAARRVAVSRGCGWNTAEDLAQETLARVLVAAARLDPAARLPFAVTTARNLAVDAFRAAARDGRNQHRLLEPAHPAQPDDMVLAAERSQALSSALDGLDPAERAALVFHSEGVSTAELAERDSTTPGAVAARLARSRARLRVDYVLALRNVQLPTKLCRPVLLAVSASDIRRQRVLDTAGHLAGCPACVELIPPLAQRRSFLAGVAAAPLVLLGAAGGRIARVSRHPAAQASAAVGVAGVIVAAAVLGAGSSPHSDAARTQPAATTTAAQPPPATATGSATAAASAAAAAKPRGVGWLRAADGAPVELSNVARLTGQRVVARGAPVQSVVSYPGFWIGTTPANRV
jgi:RNA polymerase sigma factor (sigma-70 family)